MIKNILAIILAYIIITTVQNFDVILWGMSEYSNSPTNGILEGIIEYSDNAYGEFVQDSLIAFNHHLEHYQAENNTQVYAMCYDKCIYLEYGDNGLSLELGVTWKG